MTGKLAKHLNESNINVMFTQSASWFNLTSALENLRVILISVNWKNLIEIYLFFFFQKKKARIVFVNFDTLLRSTFFCEVYRTFDKQLRERYVWILTGNDFDLWNLSISTCTKQQITDAAHGHIIIDSSYAREPSLFNINVVNLMIEKEIQKSNE